MNKNTHFVSGILVASVILSTLTATLRSSAAGAQKANTEVKGSAKIIPAGKSKSKLKTRLKTKLKKAGVKAEPLEIGDFGQTRS